MRYSLFVVLISLAASPAIAQTETRPPQACALHEPAASRLRGLGTILRFEPYSYAHADIPRREARMGGAIDPHYIDDLRAFVRQDNGWVQYFDVPDGLHVKVGDRVMLHGSYVSTSAPCTCIPALIGQDFPVG